MKYKDLVSHDRMRSPLSMSELSQKHCFFFMKQTVDVCVCVCVCVCVFVFVFVFVFVYVCFTFFCM